MDKEIIEIPVLSDALRKLAIPISPVVRANGFLFVTGLPPLDPVIGQLVKGDVEAQSETALRALKHTLESAGSSLEKVVKATAYVSNAGGATRPSTASTCATFRTAIRRGRSLPSARGRSNSTSRSRPSRWRKSG